MTFNKEKTNNRVNIKHCSCGYVLFSELDELEKECICGNKLNMMEYDDIITFNDFENCFYDSNKILEGEKFISECLISAYNEFVSLPQTHPSDIEDFCKGIHDLQKVIGMRELRRIFPKKYITNK